MTENKRPWTAGTWTLDSTVRTAINAPDNKHIAMVSYCQGLNGVSAEEHKANATLLAAAPALYEALEVARDALDKAYTPLTDSTPSEAKAIIAVAGTITAALRAANPDAFAESEGK